MPLPLLFSYGNVLLLLWADCLLAFCGAGYYFKSSPPVEASQTGLNPMDFGDVMGGGGSAASAAAASEEKVFPLDLSSMLGGAPLPAALHLSASPSTAYSESPADLDIDTVIDQAVASAQQQQEVGGGDDLRRLTANMGALRACVDDDDEHVDTYADVGKPAGAAECVLACGS